VVSVSPGNTGEVNRDAIEVTLAATPLPSSATSARPRHPVAAQPVQDRCGKPGHLPGEPRIAVQRVAVAGEPVDQRLILPSGQRDPGVGLAIREFRCNRTLARHTPKPAIAPDNQRGERLGD